MLLLLNVKIPTVEVVKVFHVITSTIRPQQICSRRSAYTCAHAAIRAYELAKDAHRALLLVTRQDTASLLIRKALIRHYVVVTHGPAQCSVLPFQHLLLPSQLHLLLVLLLLLE